MTKEEFKKLWEADEDGSGITFDDIADRAKEWGLFDYPKRCDINIVRYKVLKAAKCADAEAFNPDNEDWVMKKELRFCIEYVCPTHPFDDDGSVNVRHFRTLSEEEAENALTLLLECGCKLIALYRGNVQDGKLAEWSPLPMVANQNEDFYVDGDFDSYPNKKD